MHEVGHFFFTRAVLNNEERFAKFQKIFEGSVSELKALTSEASMRSRFSKNNYTADIGEKLLEDYSDLKGIKEYSVTVETATHKS